jgi:N-acetylmuramic acid 6-phosphate etherase
VSLTMHAAHCDEARAVDTLEACAYRVKTAIVMIECDLNAAHANALLASVHGSVRKAVALA